MDLFFKTDFFKVVKKKGVLSLVAARSKKEINNIKTT
jgi:hypothetical protein